MKNFILICLGILSFIYASGQDLESFELTEKWLEKITEIAPERPTIPVTKKKHVLIFSLHTGYEHWNIPHTEAVLKILGEKSKIYTFTLSKDIEEFTKQNLKKYDAVILNNTCSKRDHRNLFYDVFAEKTNGTEDEQLKEAKKLENNLIDFVHSGKGLMIMHGGIVMQNKSKDFGQMVGGSFDYHPKQQLINVKLADPEHPLVAAFKNQGFSHVDEPYFFKDAYFAYDFKPLLYMDPNELSDLRESPTETRRYVAWAKDYGKGRIFYSSPSHNPQSFENPELLQFLLDGMQFVTGDLKCDVSPLGD